MRTFTPGSTNPLAESSKNNYSGETTGKAFSHDFIFSESLQDDKKVTAKITTIILKILFTRFQASA